MAAIVSPPVADQLWHQPQTDQVYTAAMDNRGWPLHAASLHLLHDALDYEVAIDFCM